MLRSIARGAALALALASSVYATAAPAATLVSAAADVRLAPATPGSVRFTVPVPAPSFVTLDEREEIGRAHV